MTTTADLLTTVENADVPLDARIAAAQALAVLGDPRATAGERAIVAAGPFAMGDPPREVTLAQYAIDRFPVTVAAYAAFLDAGGYAETRYWSVHGWAWRTENGITQPRFWGEDEWKTYLAPNHPVVGVSFFRS